MRVPVATCRFQFNCDSGFRDMPGAGQAVVENEAIPLTGVFSEIPLALLRPAG